MNWTCPFCNHVQTVTSPKFSKDSFPFKVKDVSGGPLGLQGTAIGCSNPDCQKLQIDVEVIRVGQDQVGNWRIPHPPQVKLRLTLVPESLARPQPDYIPRALVEDYLEACLIRDKSPKASATLARRCIQGMIRDFASVRGTTLFAEVSALKKLVEEDKAPRGVSIESVEAIDRVRSIGNIGAHMEKDINLIIPVEPDEAQVLISLIESLFDEWYVERHQRQERFAALNSIADQKASLKLPPPVTP